MHSEELAVQGTMRREFSTKLAQQGPRGAWTILWIPFDVQEVFGRKARVPVKGTMNGFAFRSSLMPEGCGSHFMMVNKDLQKGARAAVGDLVRVVVELDESPRTVRVPTDLRKALSMAPSAQGAFRELSYSRRKEFVDWIRDAKTAEMRSRRVRGTIDMLVAGQALKVRRSLVVLKPG